MLTSPHNPYFGQRCGERCGRVHGVSGEVGGVGLGLGVWAQGGGRNWEPLTSIPRPQPPDPNPQTPNPRPQPPDPNSINPPRLQPPNSPDPTPNYHRCVANLPHLHCCKCLSDGYAQILGHIFVVWRIFFVASLPCGESSGNPPPTPQHTFLHLSPHHLHLLKVWRSYHVTKFLWRSYHVAKLLATEKTRLVNVSVLLAVFPLE